MTSSGWLRRLMAGLACSAMLIVSGCSVAGGDTMEVTAYLEDSAGLFVGNDVGILGVTTGKITDIEPVGDQVKVTMEIDADHQVPADAGAVVVARSVATDRYIELTPVYSGGPAMADGDEIPIDRTRTPVDFDDVLKALNEFASGIGGNAETTKAIQKFINQGTQALRGRGSLLNQSVHSLAESVNGIHSQKDDIAASMKSLDVLLAAIAKDEQVAREFIQQVSQATKLLADERENFRLALRSLNRAVTTVAEFAVDNRESIIEALDGSTELMRTIVSKEEQLADVLRVLPLALQNIQRAVEDGALETVLDPRKTFPEGDLLIQLCEGLPESICGAIGN